MPTIPTDTLFSQQWHLRNTTIGQYDLNLINAWDDYTGRGVIVAVFDDGVDYLHTDLAANYDTTADRDYGDGDDDASHFYATDMHGTAVAGIIGAAANGTGVVGVAYESTLVGYRIDFEAITPDNFMAAMIGGFTDAATNVDVLNMSFGHGDRFDAYFGSERMAQVIDAIELAADIGRNGLGTIMVKAAGNSRASSRDVSVNSQDADTHQIIVAAIDRTGFISSYSSYGTPVLISAFGTPGEVVTTDRTGSDGYNPGDFTTTFNGTSAAAPMVSGVVALMLQANPNLGWRDVQAILANSARHVGSAVDGSTLAGSEQNPWNWNAADSWNGGGLHYSKDYGYGLVDALAAVRLAETWSRTSTSGNETRVGFDLLDTQTVVPDGDLTGLTFSRNVKSSLDVERVTVTLDMNAAFTADLEVYLRAPGGRETLLVADQDGSYTGEFTFHSQGFRAETAKGTWGVRVVDDFASDALSVSDIVVNIFGSVPSVADTYFYTNEFSDFLDTHSANLKDTNGGRDLLNAAAVTAATVINLGKETGTVDGVSMRIRGIEDVYAGDGDDRLTGSKGNNALAGGRGTDTLMGGKGNDDFRFWHIRDSRVDASDLIGDFGKGDDDIDLRRIDANAGTDKNDKFTFIGSGNLTGVAGQLHFQRDVPGGMTFVGGDVDGDGAIDFMIRVNGVHKFVKGDFDL